METLVPASSCRHAIIRIATERPTQFVDLTGRLQDLVVETGIHAGLINIQTLHTTTAIVVNEHEPLLLADFVEVLERLVPSHTNYHHDDAGARTVNVALGERPNGFAHCRALFMSPSVCLNVVDGRLQLGQWQRVFLAELDGPRPRQISVLAMGEGARP